MAFDPRGYDPPPQPCEPSEPSKRYRPAISVYDGLEFAMLVIISIVALAMLWTFAWSLWSARPEPPCAQGVSNSVPKAGDVQTPECSQADLMLTKSIAREEVQAS